MATASTAMERRVSPLEFGPREGAVHYARRTVATPVGRWLVILAMLLRTVDGWEAQYPFTYPLIALGGSFLMAAMVLLLADLIRTEILGERE